MNEHAVPARVGIIMATRNGGHWLSEQLASIKSQSHHNWHLLVRDDGSTDSTIHKIKSEVPADRLTILDPDGSPSGSPAGNFFAALCLVDLSEFDFIAFADQDDVWSPGKLEHAINRLRETGAQGYSCDLIAFDNSRNRAWYIAKSQPQKELDYLFQGASAGCTYVISSNAARLVARCVQPHAQAFPNNRSHDWLIYAICRSHGLVWLTDATAHIYYRQHAQNAFGALPSAAGLIARLKLSRQHWYREHVLWLSQFIAKSPQEMRVLSAVERLSYADRVRLALNASQFRRRRRDQWLLSIALLTGSF